YYNRILPFDAAARLFVSLQHKLFYIVMLFARFNLYANSYIHLYQKAFDTRRSRGGRWAWTLELVGGAFFWYCLVKLKANPMRTTTDVICSEAVEFIHGGLHLQVTHHLFPRLPRHNLRKASEMVKEFAKEEGLVYAEFGFIKGNAEVLGVLREVAEQVKLVATVASHEAKETVNKKLAQAAQRDDVFKGSGIVELR
ncbi:hypothetical protein MPER_08138, partial [Moniliophthora perniciosa FA553]